jgi:transposase
MRKQKPSSRSARLRSGGRKAGRPLERRVELKAGDKVKLKDLMSRGKESVRVIKRARVLQVLGEGKSAEKAAEAAGVGATTAREIMKRYLESGLERALREAPRPGKKRLLKPRQEQELVAMLCGPSPQGRARWTIGLATEEVMGRGIVVSIGRETVRQTMKRHALKPWREKNVVHSGDDAGVRAEDGGRSKPVREAAQPEGACGVPGREAGAVA